MIEELKYLSQDEQEIMYNAPVLVSILVAGADEDFDRAEIKQAVDLSRMKQVAAREDLLGYYREVGADFEDKIKVMVQRYPMDVEQRNKQIISELEKLNDILPKLERKFAIEFYASLKDFAGKVAEASGGIFGYLAVGYQESKLVDLPMINDPEK